MRIVERYTEEALNNLAYDYFIGNISDEEKEEILSTYHSDWYTNDDAVETFEFFLNRLKNEFDD